MLVSRSKLLEILDTASFIASRLRQLGCQLAIDDFGSGFASFKYVKAFKPDTIKIDGGFVINMLEDHQDRLIVSTIAEFGHRLRADTVAEWVETHDLAVELTSTFGITHAQGYCFHKPEPLLSQP